MTRVNSTVESDRYYNGIVIALHLLLGHQPRDGFTAAVAIGTCQELHVLTTIIYRIESYKHDEQNRFHLNLSFHKQLHPIHTVLKYTRSGHYNIYIATYTPLKIQLLHIHNWWSPDHLPPLPIKHCMEWMWDFDGIHTISLETSGNPRSRGHLEFHCYSVLPGAVPFA